MQRWRGAQGRAHSGGGPVVCSLAATQIPVGAPAPGIQGAPLRKPYRVLGTARYRPYPDPLCRRHRCTRPPGAAAMQVCMA